MFTIVLLAVLDVIFCKTEAVIVLNGLLVAGSLLAVTVKLYRRWSAEY